MSMEEWRRARRRPGDRRESAVPTWTWVLLGVLGLGAVAALWWAARSGEPAASAMSFSLASMSISVSGRLTAPVC